MDGQLQEFAQQEAHRRGARLLSARKVPIVDIYGRSRWRVDIRFETDDCLDCIMYDGGPRRERLTR